MRPQLSLADLTPDRPSLLMTFLSAIGPGTVVCKGGPSDLRDDGTSQELLRAYLPQSFSFLPVPNAHYAFNESDDIVELKQKIDEKQPTAELAFYKQYHMHGVQNINNWCEAIKHQQESEESFCRFVNSKYQLADSGPCLVVGSPEGYMGYPSLTEQVRTIAGAPTDLYRLMVDCGYAERFRLVGSRFKTGLHDFKGDAAPLYYPIKPHAPSHNYIDVGLIYLSRTSAGRVILVVAGSSTSFGTLGGVQICCDHGRAEVNHLVDQFIRGKAPTVAIPYRVWFEDSSGVEFPYNKTPPLHTEVYIERQTSLTNEAEIRQREVELAKLVPVSRTVDRSGTLLTKYFREKEKISCIVKALPDDVRDDGTAKDLVEAMLPDTTFIPVPSSLPYGTLHDLGFQQQLNNFTREPSSSPFIDNLKRLNSPALRLFQFWKEVLRAQGVTFDPAPAADGTTAPPTMSEPSIKENDKHRLNQEYKQWVEQSYSVPQGPILILGAPDSYVGAEPAYSDVVDEAKELPELARILRSIGYPNRFELQRSTPNQSSFYDRLTMEKLTIEDRNFENPGSEAKDYGMIYLSRGLDDRDVLIIGGSNWEGTLGGAQLLFTERRPTVDRAIQEYLDRKRDAVEILYLSRKIVRQQSNSTTASSAPGCQPPFPLGHPSIEMDVEIVASNFVEDYHYSQAAHSLSDSIRKAVDSLEAEKDAPKPVEPKQIEPKDDFIECFVKQEPTGPTLEFECKKVFSAPDTDGFTDLLFCSEPTGAIYEQVLVAVQNARQQYNLDWDGTAYKRNRCYSFMVVGPTGCGKEFFANFVHAHVNGLDDAVRSKDLYRANVAGLAQNLLISEFFGHKKGAFTGATTNFNGMFHRARAGGTVVMDEFAAGANELQDRFQPMLLRTLQFGKGRKMGDVDDFGVNTFFIASTNRAETLEELDKLRLSGVIRADLLYRIPHKFELPHLRHRPLEALPAFLWRFHVHKNGQALPPKKLSLRMTCDAVTYLINGDYPGNFRQLDSAAAQLAFLEGPIDRKQLASTVQSLSPNDHRLNAADNTKVLEVVVSWDAEKVIKPSLSALEKAVLITESDDNKEVANQARPKTTWQKQSPRVKKLHTRQSRTDKGDGIDSR